jgi:glycerol-3-phosphate acyltransferase PlsY
MQTVYYVAALAFGYLLGSIPFGLIFTQLAGTQDIRAIGSGSIGATNVLRTGRYGLAQGHRRRGPRRVVVRL